MKFDAVSFIPQRPFRSEVGVIEFDTDVYCFNLDRAITLYLKDTYLNRLLGDTAAELRQMRKWYFFPTRTSPQSRGSCGSAIGDDCDSLKSKQ
jgi:hypothetical protein